MPNRLDAFLSLTWSFTRWIWCTPQNIHEKMEMMARSFLLNFQTIPLTLSKGVSYIDNLSHNTDSCDTIIWSQLPSSRCGPETSLVHTRFNYLAGRLRFRSGYAIRTWYGVSPPNESWSISPRSLIYAPPQSSFCSCLIDS